MIKQTQNTFSDGLNTDLNALVTPNTVMTNCLNGTLITYNGNEQVLQNDMGNAKVEDAFLPQGYVPVGMKEYGGIIYVASYNPEQKTSQLGCFPSPEQTFENSLASESRGEVSITGGGTKQYKVFEDNLKLKPGNRFIIGLSELYGSLNQICPNFNNSEPRKRHWSIDLYLMTSSGLLSKITDQCSPGYKIGGDSYFFTTQSDLSNVDFLVYGGNLSGAPYIQATENLATRMNVSVISGKSESNGLQNVTFKVTANIVFDCKCLELDGEGLSGIIVHAGGSSTTGQIKGDIAQTDDGLYAVTYYAEITETGLSNSEMVTLTVEPLYTWTVKNNLKYERTYSVEKIGSGKHYLRYWRYYYDPEYITITWGLESYPEYELIPHDLSFTFYNYHDHTPVHQELIDDHSSYDGVFSTLISMEHLQDKTPYIVVIDWTVGETKYRSFRWIITSSVYNLYYQEVDDFFKSQILDPENCTLENKVQAPQIDMKYQLEEFTEQSDWANIIPIIVNSDSSQKEGSKQTIYKYKISDPQATIVSQDDKYPFTWEITDNSIKLLKSTGNNYPTPIHKDLGTAEDTLPKADDKYINTKQEVFTDEVTYIYNTKFKYKYENIGASGVTVSNCYQSYAARNAKSNNNIKMQVLVGCSGLHHGWMAGKDDHWVSMDCWTQVNNDKASAVVKLHDLVYHNCDCEPHKFEMSDYYDDFCNQVKKLTGNNRVIVPIIFTFDKSNSRGVKNSKSVLLNYLVYNGEQYLLYWADSYMRTNITFYNGTEGHNDSWTTGTYVNSDTVFGSYKNVFTIYTSNECIIDIGKEYISSGSVAVVDESSVNLTEGVSNPSFYVNSKVEIGINSEGEEYNKLIGNTGKIIDSLTTGGFIYETTFDDDIVKYAKGNTLNIGNEITKQLQFQIVSEGKVVVDENKNPVSKLYQIFDDEVQLTHIIPGNSDISSKVESFKNNGVDNLLMYLKNGYITYGFLDYPLNPDIVYKAIYNVFGDITSVKQVNNLAIGNIGGERHIILPQIGCHAEDDVESHDTSLLLGKMPTANAEIIWT